MTDREELELILRLIKKQALPLSPILEYAIKERIEKYTDGESCANTQDYAVCENSHSARERMPLSDYEKMFSVLSVSMVGGKKAPNKAVMLLSIIYRIETEDMVENKIYPDEHVVNAYKTEWKKCLEQNVVSDPWKPYYHLKSEPFWHFKEKNNKEDLVAISNYKNTMSIGKLRSLIKYAYLDEELFEYMRDEASRARLRHILIKTYIEKQ